MNNKGFMLAETIIVSTILITIMVSMYTGYNKLYIQYQKRANYYDIDLIYAGKAILKNITDSSSDDLVDVSKINDDNNESIALIKSTLDIQDMILINTESFNSHTESDEGMNEYISYLKKHISEGELESNKYILVMSRKDNNQYKYGYLKIA